MDLAFDVDLSVARSCSACICELSEFCHAVDVIRTVARMMQQKAERVFSLTLFCCAHNDRARELCMCAWLLVCDSHSELTKEDGWSDACERVLLQMEGEENDEFTKQGFASLARLLFECDGQLERSASLFERHCDLQDHVTLAQYSVLQALRGNIKDALKRVEDLARDSPQLYFFTLAVIQQRNGNIGAALAAIQRCEQTAEVLICKGRILLKKGLPSLALQAFQDALLRKSELPKVEISRIECQIAMMQAESLGKYDEAEERINARLKSNIRDDEAWLELAIVQGQRKGEKKILLFSKKFFFRWSWSLVCCA